MVLQPELFLLSSAGSYSPCATERVLSAFLCLVQAQTAPAFFHDTACRQEYPAPARKRWMQLVNRLCACLKSYRNQGGGIDERAVHRDATRDVSQASVTMQRIFKRRRFVAKYFSRGRHGLARPCTASYLRS